jgi:NADH:ubiquinone oxidoreductase 24 kD subunit
MKFRAKEILLKYPTDRRQSAIMPLLDLAQRQK